MQNISLHLEDERGNVIERTNINFANIILVLESIEAYTKKYPWLSSIDPYGYTVFNTRQAPKLIGELKKLKEDIQRQDVLLDDVVDNTISFLIKVAQHSYARFIGD
ncbi:MAG: hypothetical protein AAB590_03030 [Patescibacteria group bacterium]